MTILATFLILLYCFGHSYWNFLVKKSNNPPMMLVSIAIGSWLLPFPFALFFIISNPPSYESWIYIFINGILQIFYYGLLGRAYKLADMSIVYPLARGSAVFFIPIWGIIFFNESISSLAILGIGLIFFGLMFISVIPLMKKNINISRKLLSAIILSILVGLNISLYTIFDKKAVSNVNPFIYVILITILGSLGALLFTGGKNKIIFLRDNFKKNYLTIISGSIIMYLAYSVMLFALKFSKISYAGTARELTIIVGIIWSYFLLREKIDLIRIISIFMIFIGAVTISLSK